jgi:hypothetical protein
VELNCEMHLTEIVCEDVDWIKPAHDSVEWQASLNHGNEHSSSKKKKFF